MFPGTDALRGHSMMTMMMMLMMMRMMLMMQQKPSEFPSKLQHLL
jgi:hypothetical protein